MIHLLPKIGAALSVVSMIRNLLPDAPVAKNTGGINVEQYRTLLVELDIAKRDNKAGKLPATTEYGFASQMNRRFDTNLTPRIINDMWNGVITVNDL